MFDLISGGSSGIHFTFTHAPTTHAPVNHFPFTHPTVHQSGSDGTNVKYRRIDKYLKIPTGAL